MNNKIIILIVIIIALIPLASAKSGHISLLTVSGINESEGGTADIFLEIKPGKGTIYIDSFPFTKLDTQISTRFANQVACDFLKEDCSRYDFFYTIRSKASIVGGPSAGAAISVLTISTLANLEIDEKTVMTGTVNSGGLIGPVAGINEKIEAAINNGFTTIIIPKWQSTVNITNLQEKEVDEKITIIKASNVEEAVYHFTGKNYLSEDRELKINKQYSEKMKEVADILCKRSKEINSSINKNNSLYVYVEGFLNQSNAAKERKDHYSRASFCFSANLRLRDIEYENKSKEDLKQIYEDVFEELEMLEEDIYQELKTLSDLETYMVVSQRVSNAKESYQDINKTNISASSLAYTKERIFSAIAWAKFFGLEGDELDLNDEHLRNACLKKTSEAEERINYADLYLPEFSKEGKENVEEAYDHYHKNEYVLCIFKASKAKSEANILLTAVSMMEEDLEKAHDEKLSAIKQIIIEQEEKNLFPILGYSYYEYSKSLKEYDIGAAITFAEYALELSKLDMYFPQNKKIKFNIEPYIILIFFSGVLGGAASSLLIRIGKAKKRKNGKKRK